MTDTFSNICLCIGITFIALLIILSHNAKVKCEKSGGFLVSERLGKSYRLACVK